MTREGDFTFQQQRTKASTDSDVSIISSIGGKFRVLDTTNHNKSKKYVPD
jgi:hypothetical protein